MLWACVWPLLCGTVLWINLGINNDPDIATEHHSFSCFLCSTKHADSIDLELEVDPLNVDHFSCTPLVRAGSETS